MASLLEKFTELSKVGPIPNNPISLEERQRLNHYVLKAQRGQPFTIQEVNDYREIVAKLEEEKPDDRSVWALAALGAFLVGLYLLSRRDE